MLWDLIWHYWSLLNDPEKWVWILLQYIHPVTSNISHSAIIEVPRCHRVRVNRYNTQQGKFFLTQDKFVNSPLYYYIAISWLHADLAYLWNFINSVIDHSTKHVHIYKKTILQFQTYHQNNSRSQIQTYFNHEISTEWIRLSVLVWLLCFEIGVACTDVNM